jgi:hypothetical protein
MPWADRIFAGYSGSVTSPKLSRSSTGLMPSVWRSSVVSLSILSHIRDPEVLEHIQRVGATFYERAEAHEGE